MHPTGRSAAVCYSSLLAQLPLTVVCTPQPDVFRKQRVCESSLGMAFRFSSVCSLEIWKNWLVQPVCFIYLVVITNL